MEKQSSSSAQIEEIRVFLNNVDLYQNNAIAKHLLRESEDSLHSRYSISGTIFDHDAIGCAELKNQLRQCLHKSYAETVDMIAENDFIIYHIGPDPEEMTEIEKVLAKLQAIYDNDSDNTLRAKSFILISTPLTWAATQPRNAEAKLFEREYRRRRSHPSYGRHKHIEFMVNLFEKKVGGKVQTLIVCPGHTYGGANDIFHYIFKLGFYQRYKVPVVEPGTQTIPLLYVYDLARIIAGLIEEMPPPETRYIVAVQPNTWQMKKFTRAIVESLTGNIIRVGIVPQHCLTNYQNEMFPQRVIDAITTPFKLIPSYLKDFRFTFESLDDIGDVLADEYRKERNLMPLKILIDGPPLVGKTTLAKELAKYYNLNYINPVDAVHIMIEKLQTDLTIADKAAFDLDREKLKLDDEAEAAEVQKLQDHMKETIDIYGELLDDLRSFVALEDKDAGQIIRRTEMCLGRILRSKLFAENQGYVIDGFPFTYDEAKKIFFDPTSTTSKAEAKEAKDLLLEEDSNDDALQKLRCSLAMPNQVVLLDTTDELVWQRGVRLSPENALQSGNNEEAVCKRLDDFRERNEHEDTSLTNFFFDNNLPPLNIDVNEDTKSANILDAVKERIGPPHTYPLTPFEKIILKNAEAERNQKAEEEFQRKQKELAQKIRAKRLEKLQKWTRDFEALRHEEELAEEAKTLPLREYLGKFVVPTVSQGILEIARLLPDDPVDYLAEYLLRHSRTDILSDDHTNEMKRLLLDEGNQTVLNVLDSYVSNEQEFKCTDFAATSSAS